MGIWIVLLGLWASADDRWNVGTHELTAIAESQEQQTEMAMLAGFNDCEPQQPKVNEIGDPIAAFERIIAIGEKLWELVKAGKPVVSVQAPLVHALPNTAACWRELEYWSPPRSQLYEVNYKNGFGSNVVKFRFRVISTAGGKYQGQGKYLANVTVQPAQVSVAWGYNFNAETQVGNVINLGSNIDPVAGLELMVQWRVATPLKEGIGSENFFLRGDQ